MGLTVAMDWVVQGCYGVGFELRLLWSRFDCSNGLGFELRLLWSGFDIHICSNGLGLDTAQGCYGLLLMFPRNSLYAT